MSANQVGFDSKMIGSKFSMNLRKKVLQKAVLQENQNDDTSAEKLASIKKRKVESKISKLSRDNSKNGVLMGMSKNMLVNLPTVNTSFTFDQSSDKTSSEISSVKKHPSSFMRPKRGLLKTLKESSKENVNLELVPPKARKRKRDSDQNNRKVKKVDTSNRDTLIKQGSVSSINAEVITSNSTTDNNNLIIKNSDFINSCNDETDASIENVKNDVGSSTMVGSESLKKPNTRRAKGMLNKKFKDDDKSVDLEINSNTSKSPSVQRARRVKVQASKSKVVKSVVQKSTKSKLNLGNSAGKEIKAGLARDVKSQKIVTKTLGSKKESISAEKITNYFNAAALNQNEETKTTVISKDHVPIYNKCNQPSEEKEAKKYSRISDVYNIEYDEDMKNSPVINKKKSKKAPKKSKNSKSKVVASKSQFVRGTKKDKTSITSRVKLTPVTTGDHENNPASDFHQDSDDDVDVDPGILDSEHLIDEPSSHSQVLNKDVQKKTSSNERHAVSSFTVVSIQDKLRNPTSQTPEKQKNADAKFALTSSSPAPIEKEPTGLISDVPAQDSYKNDNGSQNMMTFLSDFEASFLRPQLTSTPDNTDPNLPFKKPVISKRHPAVRMLEISSIPPIKPVQEPCFVSDLEFESPEKIDVSNITLFESPSKTETEKTKETKHQKKAGKKCQTKLNFGKSCKAAQKNETEKISPHCVSSPETEEFPGEKPHPKSSAPKRVLREKKKIVLQEVELSEDESEFEDDFFHSEAESEDAGSEKKSNDLPSSPVKYIEVLKPRVSYSPSVKPSFSRTKKATLPVKEYSAKEEKLIQSMNEHFSELDSLELCIE